MRHLTVGNNGELLLVTTITGGGFAYYRIGVGISIAAGQIMKTPQLEITATGSLEIEGMLEVG